MKKESNRFSHQKKRKRKTDESFQINLSFSSVSFCGERGSRTYAFKKYHKIANH